MFRLSVIQYLINSHKWLLLHGEYTHEYTPTVSTVRRIQLQQLQLQFKQMETAC